jgi:hypothetical protein
MRRIPHFIHVHGGPGETSTARATRHNLATFEQALGDVYTALWAAPSHDQRLATLHWVEFKAQLASLVLRSEGTSEDAARRVFAALVVALHKAQSLHDSGAVAVVIDIEAEDFRGLDLPGLRALDQGEAPLLLSDPSTLLAMARALCGPFVDRLGLETSPQYFCPKHQKYFDDGLPVTI